MRALLLILDGVGVGGAPDAHEYGDAGADTLGHIFFAVPNLSLPNLERLGLPAVRGLGGKGAECLHGRMRQRSPGKDSTTGHWELAGIILDEPFPVFENFPPELVTAIESAAGVTFLGNYAQSGTTILRELGGEHLRTGHPILYTSADSVLQIAAHDAVFPTEDLYRVCEIARRHADPFRIGRVIARPFTGEPGNFRRTPLRHDYSLVPPPTVLNALDAADHLVHGIGKIPDIFANSGVSSSHRTASNAEGMLEIDRLWDTATTGLLFANLVDFDTLYGHRRDPEGYAGALVEFDHWLGGFLPRIAREDLVIVTADHGNDPTHTGTDHTREEVPLFVVHRRARGSLGTRETFADVAATLAEFFRLSPDACAAGTSCLSAG